MRAHEHRLRDSVAVRDCVALVVLVWVRSWGLPQRSLAACRRCSLVVAGRVQRAAAGAAAARPAGLLAGEVLRPLRLLRMASLCLVLPCFVSVCFVSVCWLLVPLCWSLLLLLPQRRWAGL